MRFGFSEECLCHDPGPRHPETPSRLEAIRERLVQCHGVEYVEAPAVSVPQIESAHDPAYVEEFRQFCADGGGDWDPDTVAVEATWDAARRSAGLACWAARRALAGDDGRETPFSLGRPPGHHAVSDDAMGFCFLNNVAIAAQCALGGQWPLDETIGTTSTEGTDEATTTDESAESPSTDSAPTESADRVAIVDWDVHHGNGTQEIFESRGDVFVVSIHETGLYPGTGKATEIGVGDGEGTTMNVPMPATATDAGYLAALETVIAPALGAFDPDLLLVSAGFDAHRHDPISRVRLTTEAYALLTDRLRSLARETDAGVAFVLEGGYNLEVLADSVAIVHETFDGREPIEPTDPVDDAVETTLDRVATAHGIER